MDRDDRLDRVITDYLRAVESGQRPDADEWLARHADLADDLRSFLDAQNLLDRAAAPLRDFTEGATLPATTSPHSPLGVVRYVGDYELQEEIARGGMGVVFKARQVSLNRVVALKMILAGELAGPEDVARFRAEAEAAAKLDHPNVLPIHEVGEHNGQQYFSMKLVAGGSLAEQVPALTAQPRRAATVVAQVARAVHHAHQRGVLHRDLKPANVLLDADGTPYVSDFGLARKVEGDSGLTRTGAVVGTPSYMAPEQAAGRKGLTAAADVYSLGAILYECLTGQPPFRGPTPLDTLLQVMEKEPDRPCSLNHRADRDLETIALKCLDKEPRRRYESAAALADDLERWQRGEPIRARPIGPSVRLWRWCRRNPAVAGSLMATAAALLTTTAISTIAAVRISRAQEGQRQALRRVEGMRLVAVAETVRPKNPGLALLLATEGAELAGREFADIALRNALDSCDERRTFVGHTQGVWTAWFRDGGKEVFTVSDDATARRWDAASGKELARIQGETMRANLWDHAAGRWEQLEGPGNAIVAAAQTKAGLRLLATTEKGFVIWDEEGRTLSRFNHQPEGSDSGLYRHRTPAADFSPDGSKVVIVYGQHRPPEESVFDVKSGKRLYALRGHSRQIQHARFSPDGTRLITCARDRTARVWDAATGKHLRTFAGHKAEIGFVAFSPDGKRAVTLAWTQYEGNVAGRIWEVETATELGRIEGRKDDQVQAGHAFFSPDGRQVVTCEVRLLGGVVGPDMLTELCVWDGFTGKRLHALLRRQDDDYRDRASVAAYSPDGRLLAAGGEDGVVRVCDLVSGRVRELRGHEKAIQSLCFHSDGEKLLSAAKDGTARLWDLALGPDRGVWRDVRALAASRDGRRLLIVHPGQDRPAALLDRRTGKQLALGGHRSWIDFAAFSADGRRVLTASFNAVHVWDAVNGKPLRVLTHKGTMIDAAAFTPDGHGVFAVSRMGPALLWDVGTGKQRGQLAGPVRVVDIQTGLFSPDGTRLLTTNRRLVPPLLGGNQYAPQVWDVASGKPLHTFADDRQHKVGKFLTVQGETSFGVLSPDGTRVLTCASNYTARLWEAETGERLAQLVGHTDGVHWGAFSLDGTRVVTASSDGSARLWDADGNALRVFRGHEGAVRCVHFSADGRLLVTAADDRTARLWDVATGRQIGLIQLAPGRDTPFATFIGDEVLTMASGVVRIRVADALAEARRRKPRELTAAEREKYEVPGQ